MTQNKPTKYKAKYFGDGEDEFSETEWEEKLWILVREAYTKEVAKNPKFNVPDWVTIMDCEEKLRKSGVTQTFRENGVVVK